MFMRPVAEPGEKHKANPFAAYETMKSSNRQTSVKYKLSKLFKFDFFLKVAPLWQTEEHAGMKLLPNMKAWPCECLDVVNARFSQTKHDAVIFGPF